LVLGASGRTGRAITKELLQRKQTVRAFVHRIDERSEKLKAAGAEIFVGSMADTESMSAALAGVEKAYFVAPWTRDQLDIAMTFAVAAAKSDLKLIVAITQWLSQAQHPALATRQSYLTDNVFRWIPGVDVVTINTGWFADNYMQPDILAIVAQLGKFPFPLGDGKTAPVSNEDIARVVVAALLNPAPYVGKTLRPTGPELLSPKNIAETFSRVLGSPVKYDNIPEKLFLKALQAMGIPVHQQAMVRHYMEDYKQGGFAVAGTNNVVLEMTGQPAEDFETIVRRYVAETPVTQPGLGNKLKALGKFIGLLLTKPINFVRYEREQGFPTVENSQLSADNPMWVKSHGRQNLGAL
jgi:NAD(P)H dehydrogenase (quinone)